MVVNIRNLTTYYDTQKILDNVSFSIRKKRITCIIGPSGCGKTTLLMTLSGLVDKYDHFSMQGEVNYQDMTYTKENIRDLVGKTGFVFQQPLAFPLSIEKNMGFATKYAGLDKDDRERIAMEKLKQVNLWEEVKDNLKMKASRLSGGQQQRLCIARALTMEPDVLLLDEPCSALDVKNTAIIENMLLELKEDYSIIVVTHNLSQAKRISDDIIFLNEGRLIESGSNPEIFENPCEQETRDYLHGNFG